MKKYRAVRRIRLGSFKFECRFLFDVVFFPGLFLESDARVAALETLEKKPDFLSPCARIDTLITMTNGRWPCAMPD